MKQQLLGVLQELGQEFRDFGCYDPESIDYPDIAAPVARAVARGEYDCAILVCGTGAGMGITANKVRGIRAVVANDIFTAHQAREHLNAQVLCLGERIVGPGVAAEIVRAYLDAEFQGGRHARRVDKIHAIESSSVARAAAQP